MHDHSAEVQTLLNQAAAELERQERALRRSMRSESRYSPRRRVEALSADLDDVPF